MSQDINPYQVMADIDAMASSLDTASRLIYEAIVKQGEKERLYKMAYEIEVLKIVDECKEAGTRVPAEDIRRALAHHRMDNKVYADYLQAEAEVNALTAASRLKGNSVSAKQSLLAALRDEVKVASM